MKQLTIGLFIFSLGLAIGYLIHYQDLDPFIQGLIAVGASGGFSFSLMMEVMGFLRSHLERRREKRSKNNKLIVNDIKKWLESSDSLMANIECSKGDISVRGFIRHRNSKDPAGLDYPKATKIHLKAYNALSLWEEAKTYSQRLKKEGMERLKQFQKRIDESLSNISLTRTDKTISPQQYYNFNMIRDIIFVEIKHRINGKSQESKFIVYPKPKGKSELCWSSWILARGNEHTLKSLRTQIEDLINNVELQEIRRKYDVIIDKMSQNEALQQFNKKLIDEIIKPFNMDVPLKGKCRFC